MKTVHLVEFGCNLSSGPLDDQLAADVVKRLKAKGVECYAAAPEAKPSLTVVVTKRQSDIHVCLEDDAAVWGTGKNQYEALGNLVYAHEDVFGIKMVAK